QGYQTGRPQFDLRRAAPHNLTDQVRLLLLKFAVTGAPEYDIQAAMEAPDFLKLRVRSHSSRAGHFSVNPPQFGKKVPRRAHLAHHADDQIFQFRRAAELLPLEHPAQYMDAILAGRLGEVEIATRLLIHGSEGILARFGLESQPHRDGLRLGSGEILQVL